MVKYLSIAFPSLKYYKKRVDWARTTRFFLSVGLPFALYCTNRSRILSISFTYRPFNMGTSRPIINRKWQWHFLWRIVLRQGLVFKSSRVGVPVGTCGFSDDFSLEGTFPPNLLPRKGTFPLCQIQSQMQLIDTKVKLFRLNKLRKLVKSAVFFGEHKIRFVQIMKKKFSVLCGLS